MDGRDGVRVGALCEGRVDMMPQIVVFGGKSWSQT